MNSADVRIPWCQMNVITRILFHLFRQKLDEDFRKGALLVKQFLVRPGLRDSPVLHNINLVHIGKVSDAVRHQESKEKISVTEPLEPPFPP